MQKKRAELDKTRQANYSKEICQQVANSGALDGATHIAIYLPVRGEADPTYLQNIKQLIDRQFYLPILSKRNKNHLEFALYNKATSMKLNCFNIPEPDVDSDALLTDLKKLDAVIMPVVAIDRSGNRIGMGGGFYDRTFAFRKSERSKPELIAFAYDFQLTKQQNPQVWDVPADTVALQSEFIRI